MQYRYHCQDCGKTYIGEPTPGMLCNCTPAKVMTGTPYVVQGPPLSDELQQLYSISQAATKRAELCNLWGIANKSHAQHGSNFSGNQTLAQLILNIVAPVQATQERARVRQLVIQKYHYDIDSQRMT